MLVDLAAVLSSSHEIIIVDDGNPPAARRRIDELVARHPTARLVTLRRNGGQQRATAAGIRSALGEIIVTMDDDGGHPARLLPHMLAMFDGGNTPHADLVYGAPEISGAPLLRRAGSILNRSIFRLFLGVPRGVAVTSYRAFRSSLASRITDNGAHRRRTIPPNVSALLLSEHPKLDVVHYASPAAGSSRHSIRGLLVGMLLLICWWAPIGLVGRAMRRRRPARTGERAGQ